MREISTPRSTITGQLMKQEGIDDHHVFPANFLEVKKGIALSRHRDCILNRTLIDRTTNQMISNRPPAEYLAEIRNTAGFPFDAVLTSHCLPVGDDSPFWTNDYETFLAWRQKRLWQEIQRVTGLTKADDLESDDKEAGMTYKKKLIEVALPLEAINVASAREKSIRHGHPSTLHLWWARRPLAAARAVIFAQMVDDPSAHPDIFPTEKKQEKERQRLFRIIEELVQVGEHHQRRPCCSRRATKSGRAGATPVPRMPTIRAPRSCLTATSCQPSTIPSPAAARCRWRRSGWGWRATPATSTRWRC